MMLSIMPMPMPPSTASNSVLTSLVPNFVWTGSNSMPSSVANSQGSRQRSGFHYVLLTICQVLMCPREFDCEPHPTFDVPDVNVAPHLFYILLGNEQS